MAEQRAAKRHQVPRACERCASRKVKCDGERPICGVCAKGALECVYGERRRDMVHQNLEEAMQRLAVYEHTLNSLREQTNVVGNMMIDRVLQPIIESPTQLELDAQLGYRAPNSNFNSENAPQPELGSSVDPVLLQGAGMSNSTPMGTPEDLDATRPTKEAHFVAWNERIVFGEAERPPAEARLADDFDIHIIITAVTKGWYFTRRQYHLDNQWITVELTDAEIMASHHTTIERLAILWILRQKLAKRDDLPEFMAPTEAQMSVSSYPLIIDYWPWRFIRSPVIFKQEIFCTDNFLKALTRHAKFVAPMSWQDAIVPVRDKSMYGFSTEFRDRFYNARSWVVERDLVNRFPDLRSDDAILWPPEPSVAPSSSSAVTLASSGIHPSLLMRNASPDGRATDASEPAPASSRRKNRRNKLKASKNQQQDETQTSE